MASHELKTPLSSLKGMAQLLHRRLVRTNSPEVPSLVSMENSIRRIEVLVNDLLNISLLEMGMFDLYCRRCNIVDLTHSLVDEFVLGTNPRPIIHVTLSDKPIETDVDVERLSQVILNLLSNARKYSASGSSIDVSLVCLEHEYRISIHDTGVGIPPERLPFIFDRFYRVPDIEVQRGSSVGFGLGLYISKQIVERHGGYIEVESVLDQGSTFSIVLPLSISSPAPSTPDTNIKASSQKL